MFAVIKTGGKQYKVAKNDIVTVEKLAGEVGASVSLDDVLLVGGDGTASVGSPGVDKARVTAEVVEQGKGRTIEVFKKKRRKNYRRSNGHRQLHTKLRITDIALDGKSAGEGDAKKAQQASQKAGAKSQKQATQKATTEKSKAKSATSKTRSTQGATAKAGESKAGQSKSAKATASKSTGSKATGSKSTSGKSAGGAKSTSSKSGGKSSGGSRAKKSEE